MEPLPDLDKVYATLYSTWGKIRVDIFSHSFLFSTVFLLARMRLSKEAIKAFIDPKTVMDSGYFKLAKEAGLVLLFPLFAIGCIIVYGLLVRAI